MYWLVRIEKHACLLQLAALTGEKNSLHAQYAQLQVENTTLQSSTNTLHKQNTSLQKQLAKLQSDFEETAISHQELNETYEALVADHEQLQTLNDQVCNPTKTEKYLFCSLRTVINLLCSDFLIWYQRDLVGAHRLLFLIITLMQKLCQLCLTNSYSEKTLAQRKTCRKRQGNTPVNIW